MTRDFSSTFPKTRPEFDSLCKEFQDLQIDKQSDDPLDSWTSGRHIQLPKLPIHPTSSSFELFLTRQRLQILSKFFKDETYFLALSGPHGVGKSSIGYTAACIAFVNQMPLFYLPNFEGVEQRDIIKSFLNGFVSLNQFVEDQKIQSAISKITQRTDDENRLAELAVKALAGAKALRIVDEIQLVLLNPMIPSYMQDIIDTQGWVCGCGPLLAIGSNDYRASLHEVWWSCRVDVEPPSKEELLAMVMTSPLTKGKLPEDRRVGTELMISLAIEELGSPRHVMDFLNSHQLSPFPDSSSFFTSLRTYRDNLANSMETPISNVLYSARDDYVRNATLKTLRLLAHAGQAPISLPVIDDELLGGKLAYKDYMTIRVLGPVARQAFFCFLLKRGLLHESDCDPDVSTRFRSSVASNGFVTDFGVRSNPERRKLPIEMCLGFTSLNHSISGAAHLATMFFLRQDSGVDCLLTDPERKVVYAVQVSSEPFLEDQSPRFKSGSSMAQVLTGTLSTTKYLIAKTAICRLLGLPEDLTTKFTLNKTARCIDIKEGKKLSPWRVIPVFVTESPRSANKIKAEEVCTEVVAEKKKMDRLQKFFQCVRLVARPDLKNFYSWSAKPTTCVCKPVRTWLLPPKFPPA